MKVILTEFIKTLGEPGQEVNVAPGYARNYLIPRKLAMSATPANVKTFANNQRQRARKIARATQESESLKARLEGLAPLVFYRKSGEDGKLFGSVTNADIEAALKEQGYEVDKKKIEMDHHIKQLGDSEVTIRLQPRIFAKVHVSVQQELEEEPAAQEASDESSAPEASGEASA